MGSLWSRWRDLNPRPLPYQGSALPLSYIGIWYFLSGRRGSNSRPLAWKANALPTELLPHRSVWAKMDSNHRRYKPADLQSAPFGHSGIRPCSFWASCRIRTNDPEITNHVLWPTELKRLVFCDPGASCPKSSAKLIRNFFPAKYFAKKISKKFFREIKFRRFLSTLIDLTHWISQNYSKS